LETKKTIIRCFFAFFAFFADKGFLFLCGLFFIMSEVIHVAVAAIVNQNNEVLISQRAEESHQGGLWEFPGGKIEKTETVEQALVREILEELGVQLVSFRPLIKIIHQYTDRKVLLDVWRVDGYQGEPSGLEGQLFRWQPVRELNALEFPEADIPIVRALNLPEHYLITGKFETEQEFEMLLASAIDRDIRLVQLRLTNEWLSTRSKPEAMKIVEIAVQLSKQSDVTLMFNVPDTMNTDVSNKLSKSTGLYGIHLDSKKLNVLSKRPGCDLLSASCHNLHELKKAQELTADFVVLSPVQVTATHPDTKPLGWARFSELVDQVNMPVYALGGMKKGDTCKTWLAGGQGVAAIGNLWNPEE
jgi:8-oxo-dGTP diphosphatase